MLCGKMEKMAGTGSFHKINTEEINCSEGTVPIVKKLTEILGVNIEVRLFTVYIYAKVVEWVSFFVLWRAFAFP